MPTASTRMTGAARGARWSATVPCLAASVLVGSLLGCSAETSGAPADDLAASVEVDAFSGRANPEVPLDSRSAQSLYDMLRDRVDKATMVDEPQWPLGFRGFLVAFEKPRGDWATVRVLRDRVYIQTSTGLQEVPDESGDAFKIVRDAVDDELEPDVLTAIDAGS